MLLLINRRASRVLLSGSGHEIDKLSSNFGQITCIQFRTNTLGKGITAYLLPQLWAKWQGQIYSQPM